MLLRSKLGFINRTIFLLQQDLPKQMVKSHTSVNLRYYHLKKSCFFDELFKHQQRFFQYHAKGRERQKVINQFADSSPFPENA